MASAKVDKCVLDEVPWSDHVTPYVHAHYDEYLRILDAGADGASWQDKARFILRIDPDKEPDRAQKAVESHRKRAEWMTEVGYKFLLDS